MMFLKLTKWEETEDNAPPPELKPIWVNAVKISHMETDKIFGVRTLIFTRSACVTVFETPAEILQRINDVREWKVEE